MFVFAVKICESLSHSRLAGKNDNMLLLFDSVVILACFISLILCARSVINGIRLQFVSYNNSTEVL